LKAQVNDSASTSRSRISANGMLSATSTVNIGGVSPLKAVAPDRGQAVFGVNSADTTDPIVLKVAFVTSDAEFQAATTPNMEAKVVSQPEAAKLEKDNPVRFTGTLMSYDPDPAFMLHWDKAKVNAEDIPADKTPAKKPPVRRPAPKKP